MTVPCRFQNQLLGPAKAKMTKEAVRIGTKPIAARQLFLFPMQIMCFLPDYGKKQSESKKNNYGEILFLLPSSAFPPFGESP